MASLLFQASKGGPSSSSANPLQALTHFYEQELTDLQIDARLQSSSSSVSSRQYRQQTRYLSSQSPQPTKVRNHLFPSSPPLSSSSSSSSSTSSSSSSLSPSFAASSKYTHQNTSSSPYTQAEEDFNAFCQGPPSFQTPVRRNAMPRAGTNVDMTDYLQQRHDYYSREANLRSQDRNDGLGPIFDFSKQQEWPQVRPDKDVSNASTIDERRRHHLTDDHLFARHYNPYGQQPQQQEGHQSHEPLEGLRERRASTQQEQVWMDLGLDHQSSTSTMKTQLHHHLPPPPLEIMDKIWNENAATITTTPSFIDPFPTVMGSTISMMQDTNHTSAAVSGGSLVSTFRHAAASLPSSWPLAPWAIETEAALMEFETIYKDYGSKVQLHRQHVQPQHQQPQNPAATLHLTATTLMTLSQEEQLKSEQAVNWADEFSRVESAVSANGTLTSRIASAAEGSRTDNFRREERRGSIKTCGYMLDAKKGGNLGIGICNDVNKDMDLSDPTALLSSFSAMTIADTPSQYTCDRSLESPSLASSAFSSRYQTKTSTATAPNTWISSPMMLESISEPGLRREEKAGEIFNDDVFEGDMLQAWMETLAQEKQEADERAKEDEEKTNKEPAQVQEQESQSREMTGTEAMSQQDRLVLDMALRRLNALMHQLDHRQNPLGGEGEVVGAEILSRTTMPLA
ncbi:hypothetical protein BGX28_001363 [Mortierella sp. GBA30]|nr:hypothetical protein BGX28_001363 [Mortierella sp. GBA30]